jgi:hypothetical protein
MSAPPHDYSAFLRPPDTRELSALLELLERAEGEHRRWLLEVAIPAEMLRQGLLRFGGRHFRDFHRARPRPGREEDAARWLEARKYVPPRAQRARSRDLARFLELHGWGPPELFDIEVNWDARPDRRA